VGEEKASIEAESAGLEEDGNGQGEVWSFQYGERAVQLDRRGKESDGSCGSVETGDDNDILEEVSCTDEELPEILEVKEAGMPLPERDLNSDLIMDSFESYESISPLLKNLSKESQDLLRDREIEDDTECLLCGEFGHGASLLLHVYSLIACETSGLMPCHSPLPASDFTRYQGLSV
jgi:hypothetical protein